MKGRSRPFFIQADLNRPFPHAKCSRIKKIIKQSYIYIKAFKQGVSNMIKIFKKTVNNSLAAVGRMDQKG